MTTLNDPFNASATLTTEGGDVTLYRLRSLDEQGIGDTSRLPFSVKVLLEAALRQCDGFEVTQDDVKALANWQPVVEARSETPFKPSRVVL
ncbi:MAG: hypothetical protein ACYTFT_11475, partial [Planctomycetota bacterium]